MKDIKVKIGRASVEEAKEQNKAATLDMIDSAVRALTEVRRLDELNGTMTTAEFDAELNKASE